jgi:hypothetical protein
MQLARGALVLVDVHTTTPTVFWNGQKIDDLVRLRLDWDRDEHRIKLTVSRLAPNLRAALTAAGIVVKEGN